jgi:large subunit ribosomal protein L7Ae
MDIYAIVEKAKQTGKVDKGINEVTKAIESGIAKLVVYADDVDPKEITAHIAALCKNKGVKYASVDSKQKLGIAVGIPVKASAVAIVDAGDAKEQISALKVE